MFIISKQIERIKLMFVYIYHVQTLFVNIEIK